MEDKCNIFHDKNHKVIYRTGNIRYLSNYLGGDRNILFIDNHVDEPYVSIKTWTDYNICPVCYWKNHDISTAIFKTPKEAYDDFINEYGHQILGQLSIF